MDFNQISKDPMSRVSRSMKKILLKDDLFIDIHCHVFNYRDVPDRFIGIRIPQNEQILSFLEKILHKLIRNSDTDKLSNLGYFINFLKTRTSAEITKKLFEFYPEKELIICPLMMDMTPGMGGRTVDDYQLQIEKMKVLKEANPAGILPFIALDPNNPLMKDNFFKVFSKNGGYNFFGVKIYPSLGYLPSHPLLMDVFSICEEKNIPVTAHCSGAIVHTNKKYLNEIPGWHQNTDGAWSNEPVSMNFRKRSDYSVFFNKPANWIPVLEKFPRLRLNLAHFGGDDSWKNYTSGKSEQWVDPIIDMMHGFGNLYSDFSYTFYKTDYSKALKKLLDNDSIVASRVLYGSDYYMVVSEGHFHLLNSSFMNIMGEALIKKIAKENPMRFLFG